MQPTLFINHGGGPCFFLEPGPMRTALGGLEVYLRGVMDGLPERPRAILIVSGHWDEAVATVNAGARPPLLFDYTGFPNHTYRLAWPVPGDPVLAGRVRDLLLSAGIPNGTEAARGWDHGVFVPLKVMIPAADIPVVQLSMRRDLDPAAHLAIGRALRPLRDEGVLIIGSGQSYHNMRGFRGLGRGGAVDGPAGAFDAWLRAATVDAGRRDEALLRWAEAPGGPGAIEFHGHVLGKPVSGFRFG